MARKPGYKLALEAGQRESPQRRLGLGQTGVSDSYVTNVLRDAMGCPITSIPNIEHTTWDVAGVDTDAEINATFGDEIDIFNSGKQVEGVDNVQTTFVHPGILQTGIIVIAVGFHVFADPLCFTAEANELTPIPATTVTAPVSPDVFTNLDTAAELGLGAGQALQKASLSWGWPAQYAAWYLMNAYNFDWIVRNRYHLLSESARYIAYFSSFADEFGAGTSQVPVLPFMAQANSRYAEKGGNGICLPITQRRQGSFLQAGVESSVWRPTRDYDLANVTWGGLNLQQRIANTQFRKLTMPYYIPANTPIGLQLNESDKVAGDAFRALLSATNGAGGAAPGIVSPWPQINSGFGAGAAELSLDAIPGAFPSAIQTGLATFKGWSGLEFSMLVKGFEVTDDFAAAMQSTTLKTAICNEFGLQFCT